MKKRHRHSSTQARFIYTGPRFYRYRFRSGYRAGADSGRRPSGHLPGSDSGAPGSDGQQADRQRQGVASPGGDHPAILGSAYVTFAGIPER